MDDFNPDQDTKQKCLELVERGMSYCDNCNTSSVDNLENSCIKHKRMVSTYQP